MVCFFFDVGLPRPSAIGLRWPVCMDVAFCLELGRRLLGCGVCFVFGCRVVWCFVGCFFVLLAIAFGLILDLVCLWLGGVIDWKSKHDVDIRTFHAFLNLGIRYDIWN